VGTPGRGAAARGELAPARRPLFGNTVATLDLDGRHAEVTFLQPRSAGSVREAGRLVLTDGPRAAESTPGVAVVTGTSSTGRPQVE
jgi:hypothetical protein